ncbi:MAG TPA: oxygenase MpaB family protein [Ohtaekwangia sp.]|nr:oxygenase MpaB family protein [Ohtaekwangia sp.]
MNLQHDFLNAMRLVGDDPADELIALLFQQQKQSGLYAYLKLEDDQIAVQQHTLPVREFLLQPMRKPDWFDTNKLLRGQRFFKKYALDIMTLLGAKSLPYCYAAFPGNKAIFLTEKMRKTPGKRLFDTAHFIIGVLTEGSFDDAGTGMIQINKTRLIHAIVRYYISTKMAWDNNALGLPVNQEDMAGTNLAFSFIILDALVKARFPITKTEQEDFLYTWRFIGYQLYIDEQLLPASFSEAAALEQRIRQRHFRESAEGTLLMAELLKYYKTAFPALPAYFVDSQIRYFVGDEIATLLHLKTHPVKDPFVLLINRVKQKINRFYVNPHSYKTVIANHEKQRMMYAS